MGALPKSEHGQRTPAARPVATSVPHAAPARGSTPAGEFREINVDVRDLPKVHAGSMDVDGLQPSFFSRIFEWFSARKS